MRLWHGWCVVLGFMIAGAAMASAGNDGSAALRGIVLGANGPVTVYLVSADNDPTRYYDGYKMIAEQDGSFNFTDVVPGTYRINAKASGFMLAPSSSITPITITLHPNETRKGIRISMVPKNQVCGRVTENGLPENTSVTAWRLDPDFGTFSRILTLPTDAEGRYRFSDLSPGTYFLESNTAWYQNAALQNFRDAKPVLVGPERQRQSEGCREDIQLQYAGCRGVKIHVAIARIPGLEDQQYKVSFRERNEAGGSVWVPTMTSPEKTFRGGDQFEEALCPGTYEVVLTDNTRMSLENEIRRHKVVFDTQKITVAEGEDRNLVLTPHAMASIQGEAHFEDISRREICPARGGQYVAILREGDGEYQRVNLGDDNRFAFQNVAPGNYQLYVGSILREAVFIKSLVVEGKPYTGRRFSIPAPKTNTKDITISGGRHVPITVEEPIKLDITLSGDLANADGHVSPDVRGEPRWEVPWTRPKGSVSGRIVGGQWKNLKVKLESARYNSDISYEYSVSPAPDGTFHFANVDPGVYTLSVGGKEFVTNEYGALDGGERGIPIVVRRGALIKGLTLGALKLSAICGRVTDNAGTPQPQMRIFIESFKNGYMHGGGSAPDQVVTDANGIFRADGFTLGDYFVGFPATGYIRFFSSDGSLRAAAPLHLRAGHDAGCAPGALLELRLSTVSKAHHTISGLVSGNLSRLVGDRFWVLLMDENADGAQEFIARSNLDSEHRFTIENVPNGRYTLELQSAYGPEPRFWSGPFPPTTHLLAKQQIDVRGADVSGVSITPMELPTVTGRVLFTNLPEHRAFPGFDKTTVRIMLVPRVFQAPYSAQLSPDQTFHVGPVDAGDYELRLAYDFNKLYIRSIRLNGRRIEGQRLRLRSNEAAHLEIEISGNSGHLNVNVLPDASLPKPAPHVTEVCRSIPLWAIEGTQVVLLPDPLFTDITNPASSLEKPILQAQRVSDGKRTWLQFSNVPPGKYRAIAAERLSGVSFGSLSGIRRKEEHALLEALAALGKPVTVTANSTQEIALPDKTIDVDRLAAKMGLAVDSPVLRIQ